MLNAISIGFLRLYKLLISPLLPVNTCRFHPTCSSYAIEAFEKHSFAKAFWLSVRRVSRCHPWHEGGFDPVP